MEVRNSKGFVMIRQSPAPAPDLRSDPRFMKRLIPLLIASLGGFALIVAYFLPATEGWGVELAVWFDILASIAFILGGGNLLKVHLQKVQDKKPGWGYSGIILVSFLLTLFFGLTKLGSHPSENTEFYGESFTSLPVASLPKFDVPRPSTMTGTGSRGPVSVRRQFSATDSQIEFQGWPTPVQVGDLDGMQPDLAWKCAIEKLAAKAVPPEALADKVSYQADHGSLSFQGYMTPADEAALQTLLGETPAGKTAIESLKVAARKGTTVTVPKPPAAWAIPEGSREFVTLENDQLKVLGPVTPKLRGDLAGEWAKWPRIRPFSPAQRTEFRQEIEAAGRPLTEPQVVALDKAFDGLWTPAQLQAALDIAGVPAPTDKTMCECFAEKEAGATVIEKQVKPTTAPVKLNGAQIAVLERLAFDPAATPETFLTELKGAGEFVPAQEGALRKFLKSAPPRAVFEKDLYFALRKEGPLTEGQQKRLLASYTEQYAWQQAIGRLFVAAHQPKYPWSGDYTEQGTPFWWMYLYILQPLMTSTFAMLAFYVASAAFRAFRAKNLEATLLLVTAFIVLLRSTPLGATLSGMLPPQLAFLKLDVMTAFIMKVPNTAGNRAIMIGIALGIAATSLKVLLGLDRSYLGSDD